VKVIEPLAQGRVWLGAQAAQNGLVDEIGGLDKAISLIKEKAKIPAKDKVRLVAYPQKKTLIELLLNRDRDNAQTQVDAAITKVMGGLPWRALAQGGVLQTVPYSIKVK
jgi:protease-4